MFCPEGECLDRKVQAVQQLVSLIVFVFLQYLDQELRNKENRTLRRLISLKKKKV